MTLVGDNGLEETHVVIVDRRPFDRLALDLLCQGTPGVRVAASVASVWDAVRILRGGEAVVLVGRQLLLLAGPALVSTLRAAGAQRVIVVGTSHDDRLRAEAVRVGADAACTRDGDPASQARVLRGESGTVPRRVEVRGVFSPEPLAAGCRPEGSDSG
jgi:DNA-binding NarL/FixJ family response regulator